LKVVRSLLEGGVSLQRVRRAYDYLRRKAGLEQNFSHVKLSTDGHTIFSTSEGELMDLLREGQMAFFLAIDEAADSPEGRNVGHLYDRDEFVSSLRRVESSLERELDPAARERVWAAR
jgi:hypothetical protein